MTPTIYYTAEEYIYIYNTRRTDFWRSWLDLQRTSSSSSAAAEREMRTYRRDDRAAVARAYEILLCRLTVVGRELADCRVFIYFIHTDGWRNRLRVFLLRLSVFTSIRPDENNHRGRRPESYIHTRTLIYYIMYARGRGNAAFGRPSKDVVCAQNSKPHTRRLTGSGSRGEELSKRVPVRVVPPPRVLNFVSSEPRDLNRHRHHHHRVRTRPTIIIIIVCLYV